MNIEEAKYSFWLKQVLALQGQDRASREDERLESRTTRVHKLLEQSLHAETTTWSCQKHN